MRNFEERANRFRAGLDGSGADGNFFRTDCRFQQSFERNCGTKARHYHNSKCESGFGSNNFSQQHSAEHAVAGQHCESNSANCFSYAADGLTDAVDRYPNSECNYYSGRSDRDDRQPLCDAGYNRYRVQFDDGNSWIATSG